jgi:membrane protease YdiL (CAAX protease family)
LISTIILGGTAGVIFNTSTPEQYAFSMALVQLSPLCGVFFTCLFGKNRSFFKKIQWIPIMSKKKILWLALSILIPGSIIISSTLVMSMMGNTYISNGYSGMSIMVITLTSLAGCIGEEIGWRGFMLQAYNGKYSLFLSAVFTGLLWGAWHFRKIALNGIVGYLLFILMITEFSIIMAWIYSKTNRNLIYMIIFHLSINMVSVMLLTEREGIMFYLIGSVLSAMICVTISLFDRKVFA